MATLSLRIRNDLKRKAQELAQREGVSLNNYINAALAATVAQAETLAFFEDRLKDVDLEKLHARVLSFMSESESGDEPSPNELKDAVASPGGTTIAGIAVLEQNGIRGALAQAVAASAGRSRELSQQN